MYVNGLETTLKFSFKELTVSRYVWNKMKDWGVEEFKMLMINIY
jgi:hypothetical protein